jgi:hypothetical protein
MEEEEAKKRIIYWGRRRVLYERSNNVNGIKRADDAIKRINHAMGWDNINKRPKKIYELKTSDEDKGGLI